VSHAFIRLHYPTNLNPINTVQHHDRPKPLFGKMVSDCSLAAGLFSYNAKCVTAEYSLNSDGSVKVVNKQVTQDGSAPAIY
jgi:hypothetical protein